MINLWVFENKIISIRNKTGWGEYKIEDFVNISHASIYKILKKNKLTNPSFRKKKRKSKPHEDRPRSTSSTPHQYDATII